MLFRAPCQAPARRRVPGGSVGAVGGPVWCTRVVERTACARRRTARAVRDPALPWGRAGGGGQEPGGTVHEAVRAWLRDRVGGARIRGLRQRPEPGLRLDRAQRDQRVSDEAWDRFGWRSARVPDTALPDPQRAALGVPRTLRTIPGTGLVQRPVFDPALKQFPNAYRAGDPQFADERAAARWRQARTGALDYVLEAIADSQWADHLVLRGSVLLRTWYGQAAREPGDLDFVVLPEEWRI